MKNNNKKTYFITGGGTGGHIYPALAVFEELLTRENTQDIYYVGNPHNLEYRIVTSKGYKFLPVEVNGMPRKLSLGIFAWGMKLIWAILKACFYILKYKPNAIFGTGGYVSAPSVIAGKLLKVPYILHDCDAKPGIVTRKFSSGAKAVSLAFEDAKKFINNKNIHINGNPIRKNFQNLTREQALENLGLQKDKLTICVMGGSQGAKSINSATVEILEKLSNFQVIFQTGGKNFDKVIKDLKQIYPSYEQNKNLIIRPYFEDMISVLKASDIAIARSGSLSLSEICASKVASILVPYPHAAADHQRINARFMTLHGASLYIEDDDITGDTLFELITSLTSNPQKLEELQNCAFAIAKFDGADKIIEQLEA